MAARQSLPDADGLTGRMALFGRLFAQRVGLPDPGVIRTPTDLVTLVRAHLPRTVEAVETAPIAEGAAYMGEWLRVHADARWIAEGPYEPHVQVMDGSRSLIHLIPIVSVLRTATTAGFDGLGRLLSDILADVSVSARPTALEDIRVHPKEDRRRIVAWVRAHADVEDGTVATLWRRCAVCAKPMERSITMPTPTMGWEAEAGLAASILAEREPDCECGGLPGDVSRMLMLRAETSMKRLGDLWVTPTHTRVSCWRLEGDRVVPLDATTLAREP